MKIGVIDLGTNSIRLYIYEKTKKEGLSRVHYEREMVRLGDNVFSKGELDRAASKRTLRTLIHFREVANKHKLDYFRAVATSALREARNQKRLVKFAKRVTGVEFEIISGEEEARLIALGIIHNVDLPIGPTLLVDVGGGSTEISAVHYDEVIASVSLNLGSARAQQKFLCEVPPVENAPGVGIAALRRHVIEILEENCRNFPKLDTKYGIGSSGSIRAFGKLKQAQGKDPHRYSRRYLSKTIEELSTLSRKQLSKLESLEERRIDLILAAGIIVYEVMHWFQIEEMRPTVFALKDGVVAEFLSTSKKSKKKKTG